MTPQEEKYHLTRKGHAIYQRLRTAVGKDYPVLDIIDVFVLAVTFFNRTVVLEDLLPQQPVRDIKDELVQAVGQSITSEKVRTSLARLFEAGLISIER